MPSRPPSRPAVNYQQHFQIEGTARRRGTHNQRDARTPSMAFTNDGAGGRTDADPIDEEHFNEDDSELDDEDDEDGFDDLGMPENEAVLEEGANEVPMDIEPPFDAATLGLKEIGNLASWTVSSSKPGCGVPALRDDDTNLFWQSDGPQPHYLNIHFAKFAKIRAIRIFLDFEADESYTPTRIILLGGTGYHDLIPFSDLSFAQPKGWIDVSLDHVGGGEDGKTLRAFLVQVKVVENHQNGKDTHIRGLKIYAKDERVEPAPMDVLGVGDDEGDVEEDFGSRKRTSKVEKGFIKEPDWMGEPELR
ncbi:hypothetical protein ACMFMG_005299 [Clarireedia jacksonii]